MRCLSLVLSLAALAGCRNPCQDICTSMADLAEECGYEVTADEEQACLDEMARGNLADEEIEACAEHGDVREEWDCNDLDAFWARR